jgi:hypothetical protein
MRVGRGRGPVHRGGHRLRLAWGGERKPRQWVGIAHATERDVVRLVSEGVANNDIATRHANPAFPPAIIS